MHTPQDVLAGILFGMLTLYLTAKLMHWLAAHPDKDLLVFCLGILLAAAVAVYAYFKPYPMDYNEEGKLLVDGAKMANDTFKGIGWCTAFLTGCDVGAGGTVGRYSACGASRTSWGGSAMVMAGAAGMGRNQRQ